MSVYAWARARVCVCAWAFCHVFNALNLFSMHFCRRARVASTQRLLAPLVKDTFRRRATRSLWSKQFMQSVPLQLLLMLVTSPSSITKVVYTTSRTVHKMSTTQCWLLDTERSKYRTIGLLKTGLSEFFSKYIATDGNCAKEYSHNSMPVKLYPHSDSNYLISEHYDDDAIVPSGL